MTDQVNQDTATAAAEELEGVAENGVWFNQIDVGVGREEDDYYDDLNIIALEIFADLSSIEVLNGTKDPIINDLVSEFVRITQ